MATVVYNTGTSTLTNDSWNPKTMAGWPFGSSSMSAQVGKETYTYYFPFEPIDIQFSGLANEYVTIDRPGTYPLVERKGSQLAQVSFSFLVINRQSRGVLGIESDLRFLNKFVSAQAPVQFSGTGTFLTSISRAFSSASLTPRAWRITEFSITTKGKTETGNINQAECSITLMEDRNPTVKLVKLPAISYKETPPAKSKKPSKPNPGNPQPTPPTIDWTVVSL